MSTRLSVEQRRAQLIGAAIGLAESKGVSAVTTRDVARAAGVSLGVVHYCFENKDAMMTELVKALSMELRDSADQATELRAGVTGVGALEDLLRIALAALWHDVEASRDRQLLTYETTTYALREGGQTPGKLRIAREQYEFNDDTMADLLEKLRMATDTEWTLPLASLSRLSLAMLDGLVLRWLVDEDNQAAHDQLDRMASIVAGLAAPARGGGTGNGNGWR
ncbi:TetR/AcrR family transcriptional regulator [Aldersonia sp. NBC_00410]|uniref:TetR/AcrR family transcriptional regulator n=1 Tax=Aldersonia sp. NBC_00410 TaxID=2975954 RepID=UPI00225A7B87|nr:TetR/AcrR family transcriptional regulator [Aldersonia sp. NBC_00410]MCX5045712.1 TetR/AcrR family transcriptional regulator [Aldersonia sp. NBC_00410]